MGLDARRVAFPLAVTFTIQAVVALALYAAPVMAPAAVAALGVAPEAVGWYIAIAYIGSMLGSAIAGGTCERFGPIRVSQAGLLLCFAGLACSASGWLPLVVAGAFLVGLGYGPTTPASSVILARAAPPSLVALTFSIKQTGVPAGGAIAGVLVPALVLSVGWQWGALAIGVACVALAAAIAPGRARYDAARNPAARVSLASVTGTIRVVLGNRRLVEMAVVSFVFGGVQVALTTYLVTFLTGPFALSLVFAGIVMSVSQLASVAGRIAWGGVADRMLGRRRMLGLLGLGMGLSCFATLLADPQWPRALLFLFAAVFGATAVGWNGVFLAEVARIAPQGRVSEATGGSLFFTFLGVVVTPPVFNLVLAAGGGYATAYAVFGIPAVAAGLRLLLVRPR